MRRRRNHVPWTGLYAGLPNLASTHEQGLADFEAPTLVRRFPAAWRVGAWAAGSVFTLVQAMLGFMPDTPRGKAVRGSIAARVAARPDRVRPSCRQTAIRHILARRRTDAIRGAAGRSQGGRAR